MRREVDITPGGLLERSFRYQPPDPVWIGAERMKRVRALLYAVDPYLNIFWQPVYPSRDPERRGRWRIVDFSKMAGQWRTTFYLLGPEGEYRDPEPCDWYIEKLRGMLRTNLKELVAKLDAENEARERKEEEEKDRGYREWTEDFTARDQGVRQTFGKGYIRRRRVKRSDLTDTNHRRWAKKMAARKGA